MNGVVEGSALCDRDGSLPDGTCLQSSGATGHLRRKRGDGLWREQARHKMGVVTMQDERAILLMEEAKAMIIFQAVGNLGSGSTRTLPTCYEWRTLPQVDHWQLRAQTSMPPPLPQQRRRVPGRPVRRSLLAIRDAGAGGRETCGRSRRECRQTRSSPPTTRSTTYARKRVRSEIARLTGERPMG